MPYHTSLLPKATQVLGDSTGREILGHTCMSGLCQVLPPGALRPSATTTTDPPTRSARVRKQMARYGGTSKGQACRRAAEADLDATMWPKLKTN